MSSALLSRIDRYRWHVNRWEIIVAAVENSIRYNDSEYDQFIGYKLYNIKEYYAKRTKLEKSLITCKRSLRKATAVLSRLEKEKELILKKNIHDIFEQNMSNHNEFQLEKLCFDYII